MTLYDLQQRMGNLASEAEAIAMGELLRERYAIDYRMLEGTEEDDELTDQQFFALIPSAILRAEQQNED